MTEKKNNELKVAVIASRFNEEVTNNLITGAVSALKQKEVSEKNIDVIFVPGAFEIPVALKKLSDKKNYDGFITIGCVIKGETAHFEYISETVSHAIMKLSYEKEMALGFCVLTCYSDEQAIARSQLPANSENNKGYEAALAMMEMIKILNGL